MILCKIFLHCCEVFLTSFFLYITVFSELDVYIFCCAKGTCNMFSCIYRNVYKTFCYFWSVALLWFCLRASGERIKRKMEQNWWTSGTAAENAWQWWWEMVWPSPGWCGRTVFGLGRAQRWLGKGNPLMVVWRLSGPLPLWMLQLGLAFSSSVSHIFH